MSNDKYNEDDCNFTLPGERMSNNPPHDLQAIIDSLDYAASYVPSEHKANTHAASDELVRLAGEVERLKARSYPHMCRAEHIEIGHADSENERCPLCIVIADRDALTARLEAAEKERDELKQHDQRLQILCGEMTAELGVKGIHDAAVRALNVQERIEGLEAERDEFQQAMIDALEHRDLWIARYSEQQAKATKAMLALESLTPGGSEFVGDVDACVKHVRARQTILLDNIKRQVRLRVDLANERDSFVAQLAKYDRAASSLQTYDDVVATARKMLHDIANEKSPHVTAEDDAADALGCCWQEIRALIIRLEAEALALRQQVEATQAEMESRLDGQRQAFNKVIRQMVEDEQALRQRLADIGEKVKAECLTVAERVETHFREPLDAPAYDAAGQIYAGIYEIDIPALLDVPASAAEGDGND